MRAGTWMVGVLLVGAFIGGFALWGATAQAQPSPQPQECVCSRGTNIGSEAAPVIIRHCQCGVLSCAVVVGSGQLQCVR